VPFLGHLVCLNHRKYACKLLCVELYTSRNTWTANNRGIKLSDFHSLIPVTVVHLQHGGVVLWSVLWRHFTSCIYGMQWHHWNEHITTSPCCSATFNNQRPSFSVRCLIPGCETLCRERHVGEWNNCCWHFSVSLANAQDVQLSRERADVATIFAPLTTVALCF